MPADLLRGQKHYARADAQVAYVKETTGPKKLSISRVQPPPTCLRNGSEEDFRAHTTTPVRLSTLTALLPPLHAGT
jgi:hypothetical protein